MDLVVLPLELHRHLMAHLVGARLHPYESRVGLCHVQQEDLSVGTRQPAHDLQLAVRYAREVNGDE